MSEVRGVLVQNHPDPVEIDTTGFAVVPDDSDDDDQNLTAHLSVNRTTEEDRAFFRWCEQFFFARTSTEDSDPDEMYLEMRIGDTNEWIHLTYGGAYDLFQQYQQTLAGDEASLDAMLPRQQELITLMRNLREAYDSRDPDDDRVLGLVPPTEPQQPPTGKCAKII